MTRNQAIKRAKEIAKKRNESMFVVYEDEEYHVATEIDLDTFFLGAKVVGEVFSNGEVEYT